MTDDALASKIRLMTLQVADGLSHMHKNGLVHRDLKLENLFCDKDCTHIVVADFGLVAKSSRSSILGSTAGNRPHMAPEIGSLKNPKAEANSKCGPIAKLSVRADVWSLALLLWEALAVSRNKW